MKHFRDRFEGFRGEEGGEGGMLQEGIFLSCACHEVVQFGTLDNLFKLKKKQRYSTRRGITACGFFFDSLEVQSASTSLYSATSSTAKVPLEDDRGCNCSEGASPSAVRRPIQINRVCAGS